MQRTISIPILLCLILCVTTVNARKRQSYDVAAYIWPAYHDEPRYQDIGLFPDHKGEWEGIYNAQPRFPGHRQPRVPLWGYFDESDPYWMSRQIDLAADSGITWMTLEVRRSNVAAIVYVTTLISSSGTMPTEL